MSSRREVDDRDSRRGREREEDRGSSRRDRDDDRGSSRTTRDDDRGSRRGGDDDRGSRRRDDDSRDGGSRRGRFEYQSRSAEDVKKRASNDSKFDKMVKPGVKQFSPNDGDNNIRILPPTWTEPKPEHYGFDVFVHYGVGPDRQSYLCLAKMQGKPDPIAEERDKFRREMDADSKADQEYLKELDAKQRVLVYLIDRDNEKEGVQAWMMPRGLDMDIVKISVDKQTGEVLPIDHPEDGYDVFFEKNGKGKTTKYEGASIARRSSPLGKAAWLEYAQDNPLPDQLQYFDYDHIAKAFGGGGQHTPRDEDRGRGDARDDRRGDDRGRERDDDRRGGQPSRERDRDRDDDRGGNRSRDHGNRDRDEGKVDLSYESVHEMRTRELEDLIEAEKLDIDPREAKDTEDLADWVCEELKLKKSERSGRRAVADDDSDDRLRKMRERRGD